MLLRNPGAGDLPEPLRIADDWEYANLVRPTLARRVGVGVRRLDRLVREMAANWESLRPDQDPEVDSAERARFLGAWNEHRRVYGYTLLQELPYALRRALRDHPDLEGVDYVVLVVDEYQDLNACDLEVIKLIGDRGCSVIGAGDDDQSIYSFRKAAPEGIRRFPEHYPDAADYALSVTQRCGSRIIFARKVADAVALIKPLSVLFTLVNHKWARTSLVARSVLGEVGATKHLRRRSVRRLGREVRVIERQ